MNNVIEDPGNPLPLLALAASCFAFQVSSVSVVSASGGAQVVSSHPDQPSPQLVHSIPSDVVSQPVYQLSNLFIPVSSEDWFYHQPLGPVVTIVQKGTSPEIGRAHV